MNRATKRMKKSCLLILATAALSLKAIAVPEFNQRILKAVETMPDGGGYAVGKVAFQNLCASVTSSSDKSLSIDAPTAQPSFCSGATYLVFLKALLPELEKQHDDEKRLKLVESLKIRGQADGIGIWGRWNSNGPCMAKFFHDTKMGYSFQDYAEAKPGDFLKLWWKTPMGKDEAGHSVIFLDFGMTAEGEEGIEIWSSNKPLGYGKKVVPYSKIRAAIFSRCDKPENAGNIATLPEKDPLLSEMLKRNATAQEIEALLK